MTDHQNIPVRLDVSRIQKLDAIAKAQCNSRSGIIRLAIEQFVAYAEEHGQIPLIDSPEFNGTQATPNAAA